jgi:hypothetical protein
VRSKLIYYILLVTACVIVFLCVIVGSLVFFKWVASLVKEGGDAHAYYGRRIFSALWCYS